MSTTAFKRLNVSDNFVVPYTANKSWDISSGSFGNNKIIINVGVNYSGSTFDPNNEYLTNNAFDRLVYNSVNLTYYPGFLPSITEHNDTIYGTIYNDSTLTTQSYYNGYVDLGNKDTIKFFPTGARDVVYVLNIPKNITGDKILPSTFELYFSSGSTYTGKIYDDGNYNLFYSGSQVFTSIGTLLNTDDYVGNVFYEQNVAILTVVPNTIRLTAWRGKDPYCIGASPSPSPAPPSLTPTPTVTPTITPTITSTPSVTPTVTRTPSVTRTVSATPSVTRTVSATPSVTPTVTRTPSVTPSPPQEYYFFYVVPMNQCTQTGNNALILRGTSLLYRTYVCDETNGTWKIVGVAPNGSSYIGTISGDSSNCNAYVC